MKTEKDARIRLEKLKKDIQKAFGSVLLEKDEFKATQTYKDFAQSGYTVESMLALLSANQIPQVLEEGEKMQIILPLPCVNDDLAAISYAEQVIKKAGLDSWTIPSLVAAIYLFKEYDQLLAVKAAKASGEADALKKFSESNSIDRS